MKIEHIPLEDTLDIRQRVLWPNQTREFCLVDGDDTAVHYGIIKEGHLVGVASVYDNNGSFRLRKFAVEHAFQGRGLGSLLLTHIIDTVKDSGGKNLWCDARESAMVFYQRFGLAPEGQRFYKEDVAYYRMSINFLV